MKDISSPTFAQRGSCLCVLVVYQQAPLLPWAGGSAGWGLQAGVCRLGSGGGEGSSVAATHTGAVNEWQQLSRGPITGSVCVCACVWGAATRAISLTLLHSLLHSPPQLLPSFPFLFFFSSFLSFFGGFHLYDALVEFHLSLATSVG